MTSSIIVTRRALIKSSAAIGFTLFTGRAALANTADTALGSAGFGVFLSIYEDDRIVITTPNAEMGQGTYDALAKILADELDADWSRVEITLSGADPKLSNPLLRGQLTGDSKAVRGYYPLLRRAGAAAKVMLRQVAAKRQGVPLEETRAINGQVVAGKMAYRYGALAIDAAALPVPEDPPLKARADWTFIGKDMPRKETELKINGEAVFGIDVQQPGMLIAALAMPAELWGNPQLLDDGGVASRDGVQGIVPVLGGFAVVADDFWTAKSAADAMRVGISSGANDPASTRELEQALSAAIAPRKDGSTLFTGVDGGDTLDASREKATKVRDKSDKQFTLNYSVPMLAHGTLEPLSCTAKYVTGEELTLWAPHQNPRNCFNLAVKLSGLPEEKITVHRTFLGGGFGRKWNTDFVQQAIEVAIAYPGKPIKVIWTREQDTQHDFYRPAHAGRISAGLDKNGKITSWENAVAGQSLSETWSSFYKKGTPDSALQKTPVYAFDTMHLETHALDLPTPIGWWRSVAHMPLTFFIESTMDELALEAGMDPVEFRIRHLTDPRALKTLETLVGRLEPISVDAKNKGRGFALTAGYDGYCAAAVDVTIKDNTLTIDHISCVFDCGLVIEPENVRRQIEGGILYGLGPALDGKIEISDRQVQNTNLGDIGALSPFAVPTVDVHLISGGDAPAGAGEVGTPIIAPALCNAIVAAGGPRVRDLPISSTDLVINI